MSGFLRQPFAMRMLPKGVAGYNHAATRMLIWSIPLLFSVPDFRHGLQLENMLIVPDPWVAAAFIGLFRNPQRDGKIFYASWLVGVFALEAWCVVVVPRFA